ncbi:MAG: L-histidine N(alpha)-methyltransferase [Acidobacteriota bacterium]
MIETTDLLREAVLREALNGLMVPAGEQKTLSPWLFYDERGSHLFEQITAVPEYYLTRTERAIFGAHADDIFLELGAEVTIAELGAGTAAKTGLLLDAATRFQERVLYQPIDVSATALDEAAAHLVREIPGIRVAPQVANYVTDTFSLTRPEGHRILALYIGSSIGNFSPVEATGVLRNLRDHLEAGDSLLLGTDLAPGRTKTVSMLEAAYDDAAGVTAAFNKNVLVRLNRELDADFKVERFAHRAVWNEGESRMEMHLESLDAQTVHIEGERVAFAEGETIHTENSYKFTAGALEKLFRSAGFVPRRVWNDEGGRFAVTLASAV